MAKASTAMLLSGAYESPSRAQEFTCHQQSPLTPYPDSVQSSVHRPVLV